MKVIKIKSQHTYISSKDKKSYNYYNYYIVTDNGTRIQIKPCFPAKDRAKLDTICEYVK